MERLEPITTDLPAASSSVGANSNNANGSATDARASPAVSPGVGGATASGVYEKELTALKSKLKDRDTELSHLEEYAKDEFEKMIQDYESLLEEVTVNSPSQIKDRYEQQELHAQASAAMPGGVVPGGVVVSAQAVPLPSHN